MILDRRSVKLDQPVEIDAQIGLNPHARRDRFAALAIIAIELGADGLCRDRVHQAAKREIMPPEAVVIVGRHQPAEAVDVAGDDGAAGA